MDTSLFSLPVPDVPHNCTGVSTESPGRSGVEMGRPRATQHAPLESHLWRQGTKERQSGMGYNCSLYIDTLFGKQWVQFTPGVQQSQLLVNSWTVRTIHVLITYAYLPFSRTEYDKGIDY